MATGITSTLLYKLPYTSTWLQRLGIAVFIFNIIIFAVLVLGNVVRYTVWKGVWTAVLLDPLAGMFWGCLPMAFATIIVS